MNFSQDWKSYFPVFSSHAPLLVSDSEGSSLGPLIFNPNPQSLTRLFFSSSLLPPPIHIPSALHYNRLEILKYGNGVLLFFPTGNNFERVGYLMVHPEGLDMHVKLNIDNIFQVSSGVYDRILRIVVNPIDNWDESSYIVRYLLVSTRYTVHWFSVCRYGLCLETPRIIHNGGKTFKNCSIVHACWSPHIFNEILVLLQSGELFLFDLEHGKESPPNFKGTRLKWQGSGFSKDTVWVSCEFSWNPRIFIVATSHAVFLVDGTNGTYAVSCLLKIELLQMHAQAQNEKFLALSRAGPDNFYFIVASNNFLLLCDVRKQMMPIIRWSHDLDNPTYINVVSLSQLRSHSRKDTFDLALKTGFCIILGSFFNETFNFFCYGSSLPSEEGSSTLKFSETNKTFYAWELPYEIAISGDYCRCGSCLLTEELSKEELPRGIDWRMKKDMVLGFSILDIDLASCCEQDEYGGFTLIRLMSSGKLELQRYQASWATNKRLKNCNGQGVHFNRYLFSDGDEKYKFRKSSVFLKLDYLCSYSEGKLTKLLVEKLKQKKPLVKDVHDEALCERLKACRVGFSGSSTTIALFEDVKPSSSLYEVAIRGLWAKLPLHILQLAFSKSQKSFASLEFLAVPHLDKLPPFFLRKSSPRSNKCSNKVQHNDDNKSSDEVQHNDDKNSSEVQHNDDNKNSNEVQHNDDIVGPILPLAFLLVLHKFYEGSSSDWEDHKFSVEEEVKLQCKEVMKVANKISVSSLGSEFDDLAVSPDDDAEETWVDSSGPKHFLLYRPNIFEWLATDLRRNFISQYKIHHTLIFNAVENKAVSNEKSESVGQGISDDAIQSTESTSNAKFGHCDLRAFNLLKTHMFKWKEGFNSFHSH